MEKFRRPFKPDEIKALFRAKEQVGRMLRWISLSYFLFLAGMILGGLYHNFVSSIDENLETILLYLNIAASLFIGKAYLQRTGVWDKEEIIEEDIESGEAEVISFESTEVVKRYPHEKNHMGFYFKISDRETLYVEGEYFEELYKGTDFFPNKSFNLVRAISSGIIIKVELHGEFLKETRTLAPWPRKWLLRKPLHKSGEILQLPIDQIVK